jgi:hypothetical protein
MRPVATSIIDKPNILQNALRQRNERRLSAGNPRTTVHQYQMETTIAAKRSILGIG